MARDLVRGTVIDREQLLRTVKRIAQKIIEQNANTESLTLLAINASSVVLAMRLADAIQFSEEQHKIAVSAGLLDMERSIIQPLEPDEVPDILNNMDGGNIVLVTNVLGSGQDVREALGLLDSLGNPAVVQLVALVDTGATDLPIGASCKGFNATVHEGEELRISLIGLDDGVRDQVSIV